eukprot:XP_002258354.1 hypothetical protein, conserved in Plasmodium species [Plasmodium knowlesi strain H]
MRTFTPLILLLVTLLYLAKSQFSKGEWKGGTDWGIPIRQYHVGGKCFIRVFTPNKGYILSKNSRVVKKFKINFSRKNVQNLLQKIPQINYPLLSAPLGILLRLGNIFSFMLTLNALKLIRNEHRIVLTDITDNICSKIFLLNAINDVVRKIPEEAPQLCKISLFCVAQFCTQIFFSRVTAYLFYGWKDNGQRRVKNEGQGEPLIDGQGERASAAAGVISQDEQGRREPAITTDLNCRKTIKNAEEAGREEKVNMLQHMCVLNQSGLIPIFVYNNLLKILHWEEKSISLFINCYVVISGILTKIYVKFFVKKKKEETSSDKMKGICLSSMFSSIGGNSYFYVLCTSIFFKIFSRANAFYEHSIKQSMVMLNTMLAPSVYVILSNILYEGIKLPSAISYKDLLYVLQNKYLLFPSLMWAMLRMSNRYGVLKFDKNLQLYFLVQAMTPPSYNLFLLAILTVSYPLYLGALYFYVLALFRCFRN